MLPKRSRLLKSEVQAVISRGVSTGLPLGKGKKTFISMKFLPAPGTFKAAAVVPKTLVKGAVGRNRLRRSLYRALAQIPPPKKSGHAVFFIRAVPESKPTPVFAEEIGLLFERISSR